MKKWKTQGILFLFMLIWLMVSFPVSAASSDVSEQSKVCGIPEQSICTSPDIDSTQNNSITTFNAATYSGKYGNQLTGKAKTLYNELVKHYYTNKEAKSFKSSITVSFEAKLKVNGNAVEIDTNAASYQSAIQSLTKIYKSSRDAFLEDYPEVFWLYNILLSTNGNAYRDSKSSTGYSGVMEVIVVPYEFYEGASKQIEDYDKGVSHAVEQIRTSIANSTSRPKIYQGIHDYICSQVDYDDAAAAANENNFENYLYAHTSANAFLTNPVGGERVMVCEGYAEAFKVLCDAFGLRSSCVSVVGNASPDGNPTEYDAHQWNYVKIYHKWYLVDTTWDDAGIGYVYYLKGSNSTGIYGVKLSQERNTFYWFNDQSATFAIPILSATSYEDDTAGKQKPGLSFAKDTVSKTYGDNAFTNALTKKTDGGLTYVSSNTSVAAVSSKGKVTIKGAGTCKITVYADPTSTYAIGSTSYTLTVKKAAGKLAFKTTSAAKTPSSAAFTIPFKTKKTDGKLTWTTSNKKVATVSSSGKVKIIRSGKVTIRVKAAAGKNYKAVPEISYKLTVKPAKVSVSKVTNTKGRKIAIKWKKTYCTSYQIQYSTSSKFNKSVKTIKNISSSKTSYTISKLSRYKTYYVRIRAYNKNIKQYGSWSNTQKIKVTK